MSGHRCKNRQAFLIEPTEMSYEDEQTEASGTTNIELSLHAMSGVQGLKTMRIGSWIKDHRVIILIDSGSSHKSLLEN